MSKKSAFFLMFATLAVLMAAILYVMILIVRNESEIAAAENRRLESYKLADQLRQTSDDLTRMARTYVISGDSRYLAYFNRIIGIRDGEEPRPVDYNNIYWDFVIATGQNPRPDGDPVALESLMREMNFTEDEFALLRQAQARSDALISLEERAINAVKGLFPDENGDFVVEGKPDILQARELVHGDAYHDAKAEIMEPIGEFFVRVDARTRAEVAAFRDNGERLTIVAVALMLSAFVIMTISYLVIQRYIIGPAEESIGAGEDQRALVQRADIDQSSSIANAWPLFTVALIAIAGIIAFTWWNYSVLTQRTNQELSSSLTTVMNTTSKSVNSWLGERQGEVSTWAQLSDVQEECFKLLFLENEEQELLRGANAHARLLENIDPLLTGETYEKFILLNPEGLILSSDDSALIGNDAEDLFSPGFISQVLAPPTYASVNLPVSNSETGTAMHFGAAVRDASGDPMCILVLKADPEESFTEILQRGRMGQSGESYAFNAAGQLISESRFDDDLRQIGLIPEGERGILNVEIRDPGGNLVEGYEPDVPREEQPLTFMASEATAGRPGENLDGYNDYRGVPVIGAWTWDETNGFGVTTEIDVAEAYASLRATRQQGVAASALTIFLIVGLTGLFIYNRSNMAAAQANLQAELVERKQIEAQLQRSFLEAKLLYRSAELAAEAKSVDAALQKVLNEICELTGWPVGHVYAVGDDDQADELFPTTIWYLSEPEVFSEFRRVTERTTFAVGIGLPGRVLESGKVAWIENVQEDANFPRRNLTENLVVKGAFAVPVKVSGAVVAVLEFFSDQVVEPDENLIRVMNHVAEQLSLVFERRQTAESLLEAAEAAEAANRAKSAFLANMSHELRTPMNAIIGYSEMLAEDAEDEGYDELIPDLEKINSAGRHLLGLINDVLDLSKIEAGRMELYLERFDLKQILEEVMATAAPLAATKNNQFVADFAADLGNMRADLTKVRQTLLNLLSNAAKFSENGTITLSARREGREDGDWVLISVTDTGIGIPEEKFDTVFEEFSQADNSTTREYGGTGLGLPISRRFCRMMGGDLTVTSEAGKGSTFIAELPAEVTAVSSSEITVRVDDQAILEIGPGEKPILVIDDDPNARELLLRTLELDGHVVITASSGEEGLDLARRLQPMLITLDIMMPGMDGWAVLRKIKADPGLQHIPVVMVSMVGDRDLGYSLGAVESLTKPVDRKRLLSVVQQFSTAKGGGYVLVVDDDDDIRTLVRRTLKEVQWEVSEAENGAVALQRVQEQKPDLILLDLMMPVMDGFEFVQRLREDENNRWIPIIVVTAKDLTEEDRRQLAGGVEHIIDKGAFTQGDMLQQIRDLAARKSGD